MPPVRHTHGHGSGTIIMKYGARKVLMRYPATYEATLTAARSEFKLANAKPLELRVDMADVEPGSTRGAVEISAGSWDLLMDCERAPEVEVLVCDSPEPSPSPSPPPAPPARAEVAVAEVASTSPRVEAQTRARTKAAARNAVAAAANKSAVAQPIAVHHATTFSAATSCDEPATTMSSVQARTYRIKVVCCTGGSHGPFNMLVTRKTRARKILDAIALALGTCTFDLRLTFDGQLIHRDDAFAQLGMELEDGAEFMIFAKQEGKKPVIYLMSPSAFSATVDLSLIPEWSFSAIYPVAPVSRKAGFESIAWDVDVRPDGNLFDKRTASEVAYLYWEATTNDYRPLSPPLGENVLPFNPILAALTPSDAVVLDIADVPTYLDKALKAMALHVEARTSFITYWLPSMLRHKHIALRFLPQADYEHAAPMRVAPAPDVVTRVFMLFRGVAVEDVAMWRTDALQTASEEWSDAVGVDFRRASDAALFRVLEWGGMEMKC